MKLYEISDDLKTVERLMDEQPDAPGLTEALAEIKQDMLTKVCNIGAWIKNLEADSDALKVETENLRARKTVKDNLVNRLKEYITANVDTSLKYESTKVVVSFRKSTSCEVTNQELLPTEYIKTKVIQEVDKLKLKDALKNGPVEGASLVEHKNIQIK